MGAPPCRKPLRTAAGPWGRNSEGLRRRLWRFRNYSNVSEATTRKSGGRPPPGQSHGHCRRCKIQDAYPVCAFSGGRARSSALGVRPLASDRVRCWVSGIRYQVPGSRELVSDTWNPGPGTGSLNGRPGPRLNARLMLRKPAHGVCMMQDRKGSGLRYRGPGPGTWDLTPGTCFLVLTGERCGRVVEKACISGQMTPVSKSTSDDDRQCLLVPRGAKIFRKGAGRSKSIGVRETSCIESFAHGEAGLLGILAVRREGIEPSTPGLKGQCSTPELPPRRNRPVAPII